MTRNAWRRSLAAPRRRPTSWPAAASDEPFAADAVAIAHAIAASLDDTLIESLRAVLADTSMTAWGASGPAPGTSTAAPGAPPGVVPWWLTVDQLIAALDGQAAAVAVPATPSADGFTLAASITAAEPMQWFHDVNAGCVSYAGGSYSGGGYVTAPDGQRYPIVVPRVETDDGDVYTADVHDVASGQVSVATLGWQRSRLGGRRLRNGDRAGAGRAVGMGARRRLPRRHHGSRPATAAEHGAGVDRHASRRRGAVPLDRRQSRRDPSSPHRAAAPSIRRPARRRRRSPAPSASARPPLREW